MSLLETLRRHVKGGLTSTTFRNTTWSASSSLANGVLGAASSALFARYLGIQDFGILVLIISLFNLLTDLSDFGLSSSIVRFGAEFLRRNEMDRFRRVVSIVFRLKFILGSVIIVLAAAFLNPIVSYAFHHVDDRITFYFLLSLSAVAINVVAGTFTPIFQACGQFRTMALVGMSRPLTKLLLVILAVLVIHHWTVELGIGIEILSLLVFLAAGFFSSPVRSLSLRIRDSNLQRQILSFNKWISLHQVIALLGGRIDVFFVGGLADARALGLYGAATKIAGLVSIVSMSFFGVLLPEFSSSLLPGEMQKKRKTSVVIVGILAGGIGLLALASRPIVLLVFGDPFAEAAPVLQIMCIGLLLTALSYPLTASLFALNVSTVFPVASALSLACFIAGNVILIPRWGVTGAAIAFAISGAVTLLVAVSFFLVKGRALQPRGDTSLPPPEGQREDRDNLGQ